MYVCVSTKWIYNIALTPLPTHLKIAHHKPSPPAPPLNNNNIQMMCDATLLYIDDVAAARPRLEKKKY